MRATSRRTRQGFTLIETLVVVVMIGLMTVIVVPRLRVSNKTKVRLAAQKLANDIELARTRALSTASTVRVAFTAGTQSYTAYLDADRDGAIAENAVERDALGGFGTRSFTEGVQYGRGAAPDIPLIAGAGAVTFAGTRLNFDTRGLTTPFNTKGVIYLTSANDATTISAVSVTAASGVRVWNYIGGAWQ